MKLPADKDFIYEMALMKIISWPMGTWPLQEYNFVTGARSVAALVSLTFTMCIVHMEIFLDYESAEKNLDVVVIVACGLLAMSKVACFRFRPTGLIENFISAVRDYQELKEEEKRVIVKRHATMGRVASANMLFFTYFSATLFAMVPIFTQNEALDGLNETRLSQLNYPMPSANTVELLAFPRNLYPFIYLSEYFQLLVIAAGNLGSDTVVFGIVFHLCGQVEVLKVEIGKFIEDGEDNAQRLVALVNRHRHLLTLADHLNDTIGVILLLQLFLSCLLICLTGFQFLLSLQVRNVVTVCKTLIMAGLVLSQTFVYSYVGEYSKNQFGAIGYLAYCSDWYNAPISITKKVMFVLMKAQYPVHLKADRFFVINLETYMSIMKTSMSYLSVLRVMMAS